MAEDPIKLCATRAERSPEPTESDVALSAGRAAFAAIPVIGGTLTEVLALVLAPAVSRRRDAWFKELADGLEDAELKIDGFRIENLTKDEAFVSAVIEATRSAISTQKDEKRDALRNGLLNIALRRSTDEDQQQTSLRYINELTVWHLRLLSFFQNPSAHLAPTNLRADYFTGGAIASLLETLDPDLQGKREFYDQVAADLITRGFSNSAPGFLHTMMTSSGVASKRTTALADAFLAFTANPLD